LLCLGFHIVPEFCVEDEEYELLEVRVWEGLMCTIHGDGREVTGVVSGYVLEGWNWSVLLSHVASATGGVLTVQGERYRVTDREGERWSVLLSHVAVCYWWCVNGAG
jgi:hypothetical protein